MARDINGNYSLPSGNPVTSNTTISSSTHNSTLADIATALTDSLSRSGKGGMLAPLAFSDGSAAAPTISFTDETNTGFYRGAAGQINVSIGGTKVLTIASNGVYSEVPYLQKVGASYAGCTDTLDDFDVEGNWDFQGTLTHDSGAVLSHSDTGLTSGKISIVQGSGPPVGGTDGDIVFYYT